jgi:hypothetical protein
MELTPVRDYYSAVLAEHGPTPQGMDWKDHEAQEIRFNALSSLITTYRGSVNDWGCGSGDFQWRCGGEYTGYDIVHQEQRNMRDRAKFVVSDRPTETADYTVASGLFNVKLSTPWFAWNEYMLACIKIMSKMSTKGFAFNCLSSYCDQKEDRLFYADPTWVFDECRKYSPRVALLHDYSPWDFTLLVRK